MRITVCSDLHKGPAGHPATDATPGWREAWAKVPEPKCRLGDMDELLQFSADEIGELAWTDVSGNHDDIGAVMPERHILGDRGLTILLHGHQFDPWWARAFGRPAAKACKLLELVWPDADVRLSAWARRKSGLGRYGNWNTYKTRAAEYAAARGARQIVFGHLHERHEEDVYVEMEWGLTAGPVHVVCTGCCCNGRLDFVEVEV